MLGCDHLVLAGPPWPKTVWISDYLRTSYALCSAYYAPVTKIVFCTFMNFRVGPSYFELFLKFSSCYSIPRLFLLTVGVASTFLNLFEEDTQEAIWITFGGQGQKRSWCLQDITQLRSITGGWVEWAIAHPVSVRIVWRQAHPALGSYLPLFNICPCCIFQTFKGRYTQRGHLTPL